MDEDADWLDDRRGWRELSVTGLRVKQMEGPKTEVENAGEDLPHACERNNRTNHVTVVPGVLLPVSRQCDGQQGSVKSRRCSGQAVEG